LNVSAFLGFAADIHCVARRRGVRSPLSKSRNALSVSNSFFSCCAECAEMTHLSVSAIGEATIHFAARRASVLILMTESLVCRWSRAAILLSNCDESVERALSACTNSRLKILAIFHVDFEHRLAFSNSGRRLVVDFCVGGEQELRDNTPPVIVAHLASICCCRQPLRAALRADNFVSCYLSCKLDRRHSHVHVVVDIFFCPR